MGIYGFQNLSNRLITSEDGLSQPLDIGERVWACGGIANLLDMLRKKPMNNFVPCIKAGFN